MCVDWRAQRSILSDGGHCRFVHGVDAVGYRRARRGSRGARRSGRSSTHVNPSPRLRDSFRFGVDFGQPRREQSTVDIELSQGVAQKPMVLLASGETDLPTNLPPLARGLAASVSQARSSSSSRLALMSRQWRGSPTSQPCRTSYGIPIPGRCRTRRTQSKDQAVEWPDRSFGPAGHREGCPQRARDAPS